jgi:hypothetical protein
MANEKIGSGRRNKCKKKIAPQRTMIIKIKQDVLISDVYDALAFLTSLINATPTAIINIPNAINKYSIVLPFF